VKSLWRVVVCFLTLAPGATEIWRFAPGPPLSSFARRCARLPSNSLGEAGKDNAPLSLIIHRIADKGCSRKLTPIRERKRSLENTSRSAYGTNFDYVPSYWSTSIGLLDRVRERRRFHGIVGNYKEQELVFS
jgi:hypothetical protein